MIRIERRIGLQVVFGGYGEPEYRKQAGRSSINLTFEPNFRGLGLVSVVPQLQLFRSFGFWRLPFSLPSWVVMSWLVPA